MNKFFRIIVLGLFLCVSTVYAEIELIDVSSSGEPGNGLNIINSFNPTEDISNDGRFVAFPSLSSNLVFGDTNGFSDIFVRDRQAGTTTRVSISSTGEQAILGSNPLNTAAHGSFSPSISENGRFVAFASDAANLVPNDINASRSDIFVHDRQTGTTELVSFLPNGEQRSWGSSAPDISADGRFVTYSSYSDMYVYDRVTEITKRISRLSRGSSKSISADGRFIAFRSNADDLSPIPDNGHVQAYIYDRQTSEIEMISRSVNGEAANGTVFFTQISANGRFVSYTTRANNLVMNDTNYNPALSLWGGQDVFVYDRVTKVTERVSVSSSGEEGNNPNASTMRANLSADGRYVVFDSGSTNLVPGITTLGDRIYVHDRQTKMTKLVSRLDNGSPFHGAIPTISPDGSFMIFHSGGIVGTDNPFFDNNSDSLTVEKLINNKTRESQDMAAQLSTGTLYRQSYKVTNNSADRIYQVQVFEDGNLVCNLFALNPGQSRQRCDTFQTVLEDDQHVQVTVTAKVSGSDEVLTNKTDAFYTGLTNVTGELRVTHRINNINADSAGQAPTLSSQQATVAFKIENTGVIELYQVKTYHDPVSPMNSGWAQQCLIGPLKPGQVRYCKKDIMLTESGLNQAMGRVQGRNAIRSATDVVNASNPTYFIVP